MKPAVVLGVIAIVLLALVGGYFIGRQSSHDLDRWSDAEIQAAIQQTLQSQPAASGGGGGDQGGGRATTPARTASQPRTTRATPPAAARPTAARGAPAAAPAAPTVSPEEMQARAAAQAEAVNALAGSSWDVGGETVQLGQDGEVTTASGAKGNWKAGPDGGIVIGVEGGATINATVQGDQLVGADGNPLPRK